MAALLTASPVAADQGAEPVVETPVSGGDQFDLQPEPGFGLGTDLLEGAAQSGVGIAASEQPGAQLPLLTPGQIVHLGDVGCLLDQSQGLQHGVVEMGGHLRPFLDAYPGGPLLGQGGFGFDPASLAAPQHLEGPGGHSADRQIQHEVGDGGGEVVIAGGGKHAGEHSRRAEPTGDAVGVAPQQHRGGGKATDEETLAIEGVGDDDEHGDQTGRR